MGKVDVRPSVPADFLEMFGTLPVHRVKAWTARDEDGAILGVGGVMILPDGTRYAFVDMDDRARRYAKTLHKTGLAFVREESKNGKMIATTFSNVPRAEEWLERLGFEKHLVGEQKVFIHAAT